MTVCFGGRYKTRTCDLPHVKRMRYQLRQSSISLDRIHPIHPFAAFVKPFLARKRRFFFVRSVDFGFACTQDNRAGTRGDGLRTSDIGHWFAMTGGREQTSDARACGEAGNDSLRHPPRDAKLVLQGGRAADATSLGDERCSCLWRSGERLPPSSASRREASPSGRESGGCHFPRRGRQGGRTDCRTSDVGHWFAMTGERQRQAGCRDRRGWSGGHGMSSPRGGNVALCTLRVCDRRGRRDPAFLTA